MATSDKLVIRATYEDGSNSTISIPSYKADSATEANFQTLANAAKNVLETENGSAFSAITNASHVVTNATTLNDIAQLPISPSV